METKKYTLNLFITHQFPFLLNKVIPDQTESLRRRHQFDQILKIVGLQVFRQISADVNVTLVVDENDFAEQRSWCSVNDTMDSSKQSPKLLVIITNNDGC
jgi:hypothetical protein